MVKIGMTYNDPDGVWEVVNINNDETVDVKNVQEGNLNIGQVCVVSIEEAEWYIDHKNDWYY